MKRLRSLYRQVLCRALGQPWTPGKPWLRTLVWKQERHAMLRKVAWILRTRPYDQGMVHSALRTLTHRKNGLAGLSRWRQKRWVNRLHRLHMRPDISLGNQALAVALMLELGRRFMTKRRFARINLKPIIDEVDEALLIHYLASRRAARRTKKHALAALLGLTDRHRLASVLLQSQHPDRWSSKPAWVRGKSTYYGVLETHLHWGPRLSRLARMILLPLLAAEKIDDLRTRKAFLDEERDPLLVALLFAEMAKKGPQEYSRASEAFWAQRAVLRQADAALQERRRARQSPFWSRPHDR